MGREYPKGYKWFRDMAHRAFAANRDVWDSDKIDQMIARGEFVVKEVEALYRLKKYRAMKERYYNEEELYENFRKFEGEINKY